MRTQFQAGDVFAMSNLYSRLVTDENHQTEALVDLLERVLENSVEQFRDFVAQVLLGDATDEEKKNNFVEQLNNSRDPVSIETQFGTPQGIPDIIVLKGGHPICIVEVKVNAPISVPQLRNYGEFLHNRELTHGRPTALVLLSHVTSLPEGFTDRECDDYGVSLRGATYWYMVAKWFRNLHQVENSVGEPLKSLVREFSNFLEEDMPMPTLDDFAIARHYFKGSHTALSTAVEVMRSEAVVLTPTWTLSNLRFEPVGIYRWRYPPGRDTHWITFGLCFAPVDERDDCLQDFLRYEGDALNNPQPIRDGFYAFVTVAGPSEECQQIPGYSESQWYVLGQENNLVPAAEPLPVDSAGWYHFRRHDNPHTYYARICPVHELLDNENRVGDSLRKWTHGAMEQTVQLWRALFGEE